MLNKSVQAVRLGRFWHRATPDELSEMYIAMLLRGLAMNLIGIFIPVYLYKVGVSLQGIMIFFMAFFFFRFIADFGSAFFVGRYGPKHAMALSTIFQIASFMLLISFQELHWPLVLIAMLWAAAMSLYYIAYHTDLSKIKHPRHAGKEISSVYGFEKVGGILGPVCGGLLATFFDARYTMAVAIGILLFSLVPIFLTAEPVRSNQQVSFKGLPWRAYRRRYIANSAMLLDNNASMMLWPLVIAVSVFTTATYAKLGIIISLSTLVAIAMLGTIGRHIDGHKSRSIFTWSVWLNSGLHLLRPFMLTPLGVTAVSMANEPITAGYRIQMLQQLYQSADSLPGRRIAFLASTEMVGSLAKGLFWLIVWIAALYFNPSTVLNFSYILVALTSLGMLLLIPKTKKALR